MMTRFVAAIALLAMHIALQLANFWFTFGLWPLSWTSFFLCGFGFALLAAFRAVMEKEKP